MLQLRQFNLQFTFMSTRTLGKDIQNQSGSTQHPTLEFFFKIAFLTWTQIMVEDNHVRFERPNQCSQFFNFAGTDEKPGIGTLSSAC
jgi:hypothetical protein